MAADLLTSLLEVAVATSAAILAVLALRRPVRAVLGAAAAYRLWLIVPVAAVAVLLPAPASRAPASTGVAAVIQAFRVPAAPPVAAAATDAATAALVPSPAVVGPGDLLIGLWLSGAALWILAQGWRQRRFLGALGPLRRDEGPDGRLFHAARAGVGPALVGGLRPRIVLPADFGDRFTPDEQAVVVAHERAHLAGGDAQINLFVAGLQAALWFNPLIHLAVRAFRVDQELACDAAVVARFPRSRRVYASAMLKTQLAPTPVPIGCNWPAGGARQLRLRILMLNSAPGALRRLTGVGLVALATLGGGYAAWAAQPAAPATVQSSSGRHGHALIAAIQDGDSDRAAELIRAGADVNFRWPGDGSPLILAARAGDADLVRLLIERGADVNLTVHGDGSPLIAAASEGSLEIVDLLLARGASVDTIVPDDETALINAARQGHLDVVRRLVEHGADVNLAVMADRVRPMPPERRSPLSMAERGGHRDVAGYLRAHGARA